MAVHEEDIHWAPFYYPLGLPFYSLYSSKTFKCLRLAGHRARCSEWVET